ncbi:MAG TPA: hypothetical protein VLT36_00635 [Candidatus Dormibacteraeota bacterium]|nr:hypothetical protein [Candidatus Dormibacteraeota bacterium]
MQAKFFGLSCALVLFNVMATEPPSLQEAVLSNKDVYGEAAIREPNGPSYEFFEKLLPPVRYVNADFHYYPIVLSAPNTKSKARLISNGSGINLRAGSGQWNDNGTPVLFRVGPDQLLFGTFPDRLQGEPVLADGYLPIVELQYLHQTPIQAEGMVPLDQTRVERPSEIYKLEAFASTAPELAENGVVFVRFSLRQGAIGVVTVQVDPKGPFKFSDRKVLDEKGDVLAWFDSHWNWDRQRAQARFTNGTVTLAIATKPLSAATMLSVDEKEYSRQREQCVKDWQNMLAGGMKVETPEPVVNNAWRHLTIQNFELINGDRIHYSQGNQYDKIYESEGSDAALAFLVWGYEKDMKRLMVPLLDFTRKGLEFHQAGFKLNDVCRYYWQTRDAAAVHDLRSWPKPKNYQTGPNETISGWDVEAQRLDKSRTGAHGLFPLEQYCGDIHTPVQTLNANSKAWRALRDMAAVLDEVGETSSAAHYSEVARQFRPTVLEAIEKSAVRTIDPPFVPVALYTNEPPHDPICDVRIGSYWNIIIGYTIGSGIFPPGSPQENWIPKYQEEHGGLFMGMLRSGGMSNTWWNTEHKLNPLYGTRYALDTLRRDDVDRSLVCFYGMLAQGFTRNTFICGEGASIIPADPRGRLVSLPPNSAANAHLLSMLRYMLVQDWDLDDNGKPETLRLLFGTPKRWLEDGKLLKVENAPTAFGPVSIHLTSQLNAGKVTADLQLPERNTPKHLLLRARVPDGWQVTGATAGQKSLAVDKTGAIDLTGMKGKTSVVFATARL